MRRLGASNSDTPSVEVVDDDSLAWSERSEDRHLIKLSIFSNEVFSHSRVINPSQIADKEDQGRPSYPLLVELIQKSSGPFVRDDTCKLEDLIVWCTYQDKDDQSVLIASSEELRYVLKGTCDTLPVKATILPKYSNESKITTANDPERKAEELWVPEPSLAESKLPSALQKSCSSRKAMEDKIQQTLTTTLQAMESRLEQKIEQVMEQSMDRVVALLQQRQDNTEEEKEEETKREKESSRLPASSVLAQAVVSGDTTMDLMERGLVRDAHAIATNSSDHLVPLASATTELEVPTADCQWVQPEAANSNEAPNTDETPASPYPAQPPPEGSAENRSSNDECIMEQFFRFLERSTNEGQQVDEAMLENFFQSTRSEESDPPAGSGAGGLDGDTIGAGTSSISAEDPPGKQNATTNRTKANTDADNGDAATTALEEKWDDAALDEWMEQVGAASKAVNDFAAAQRESTNDTQQRLIELREILVSRRLDTPALQMTLERMETKIKKHLDDRLDSFLQNKTSNFDAKCDASIHQRLDDLTQEVSRRLDTPLLQQTLKQIKGHSKKHTEGLDRLSESLQGRSSKAEAWNRHHALLDAFRVNAKALQATEKGVVSLREDFQASMQQLERIEGIGNKHVKELHVQEHIVGRLAYSNQMIVQKFDALNEDVQAMKTNHAGVHGGFSGMEDANGVQVTEKGVVSLREDLQASMMQMEEWNKTILDGISSQTTVLKNRLNTRTDVFMNRIAQLEACCSDLTPKSTSEKQWKVLEKVQDEQTKLRQDIKTLIKALIKEADKEEKEEGSCSYYSGEEEASYVSGEEGGHYSYEEFSTLMTNAVATAGKSSKKGPTKKKASDESSTSSGSCSSLDGSDSSQSSCESVYTTSSDGAKSAPLSVVNILEERKKKKDILEAATHQRTSVRMDEAKKEETNSNNKKNIKEKAMHRLERMNRSAVGGSARRLSQTSHPKPTPFEEALSVARGSVRRPSNKAAWQPYPGSSRPQPAARNVKMTDSLILYGFERGYSSSSRDGLWEKQKKPRGRGVLLASGPENIEDKKGSESEPAEAKPCWISVAEKSAEEKDDWDLSSFDEDDEDIKWLV